MTAYARHDTLLREAITSHGGMVYKVIGDALQVAFTTTPNAVSAALPADLRRQVCPSRAACQHWWLPDHDPVFRPW